jgi:hypothetical protein
VYINISSPFTQNISVLPNENVNLPFAYDTRYIPRVIATLLESAPDPSSLSVLVSDRCSATAYSVLARPGSGCPLSDSRPICQKRCGRGNFTLGLSSYAPQNLTLQVLVEDISLAIDTPKTVLLQKNSPVFLRFEYPANGVDSVSFDVKSDTHSITAIVSLQNESCPVYDLPDTVNYRACILLRLLMEQGKRQSFTTQATIRADQSADENIGVFVVLVLESAASCTTQKLVTITPRRTLPLDEYFAKVAIMLTWFLAPMALFFVLLLIERFRVHGFSLYEVKEEVLPIKDVEIVENDDEVMCPCER